MNVFQWIPRKRKSMKRVLVLAFFPFFLLGIGCSSPKEESEESYRAKVPVTVTGIETGTMKDEEIVMASSSFLNKAVIKAPVTGYLQDIAVNPGDPVVKNQQLFVLKTKEAAALQQDTANSLSFPGLIHITSFMGGTIISVDHSKGDYIVEGDQLCTIALPGSLVFIMEVPFELNRYITVGQNFTVDLPDGSEVDARIKSRLPGMTGTSQTQRFVLQPVKLINLPENLLVKVRIMKTIIDNASFLPKSCILSDEVMKQFWVMKVINDSAAVRVDVSCGLIQDDKIQILHPGFSASDQIPLLRKLRSWGYSKYPDHKPEKVIVFHE